MLALRVGRVAEAEKAEVNDRAQNRYQYTQPHLTVGYLFFRAFLFHTDSPFKFIITDFYAPSIFFSKIIYLFIPFSQAVHQIRTLFKSG